MNAILQGEVLVGLTVKEIRLIFAALDNSITEYGDISDGMSDLREEFKDLLEKLEG